MRTALVNARAVRPAAVVGALLACFCAAAAVEWQNIDEAHYVAGRKCSSGYLQGKVTLVYRDAAMAPRMEELWTSFKTKPFVVLGSYGKATDGVSHPVYRDADLTTNQCSESIFIIDAKGKRRFRGKDDHRATEVLVTLLTDMEFPKNEKQWRQFLDYEMDNLPGRGYLRYQEFRKKFPEAARDYEAKFDALSKIPRIKDLADLLKFAKAAKDHRAIDPKKAARLKSKIAERIDKALERYAPLKESDDPRVVQEAKNALADLAWAKAAL